jgi:hypothetical protein
VPAELNWWVVLRQSTMKVLSLIDVSSWWIQTTREYVVWAAGGGEGDSEDTMM